MPGGMTRRIGRRKPLPPGSTPEERAFDALALTRREGLSLRAAARTARTDPRTVLRHAGRAFRKRGHRWAPTAWDRYPRPMAALSTSGPVDVVVRDSRTARLLGEHANAVRVYVETGDERPLRKLRRRVIRIRGQPIELATDPLTLDRLAAGGALEFELYRT